MQLPDKDDVLEWIERVGTLVILAVLALAMSGVVIAFWRDIANGFHIF